jgi:hypothetical protein
MGIAGIGFVWVQLPHGANRQQNLCAAPSHFAQGGHVDFAGSVSIQGLFGRDISITYAPVEEKLGIQ